MRLNVRPDALRAAAADLDRDAAGLDQAAAEFAAAAQRCIAGAGRPAYDAVAEAVRLGAHAGQILAADLRLLRDALERTASAYTAVDERLLPAWLDR